MAALGQVLPRPRWSSFIVSPQTLLCWHCQLVRRKRTYRRHATAGRPALADDVRELILRTGKENPRWGCVRIRGELAKLGIRVSATAIRTLPRRSGLGPAPRRSGPTWREFLAVQAEGILATNFFTVESFWLRTMYVFFVIELHTRRVRVAAATRNPDAAWVTQQARNLSFDLTHGATFRLLIRDRDSKYASSFDAVFASEGIKVILTPVQAPRANAFAERWVRTVRAECLDWMLVLGRRHLDRILRIYVAHYNTQRPHRRLDLRTPDPRSYPAGEHLDRARVHGRDVLAGSSTNTSLLHERGSGLSAPFTMLAGHVGSRSDAVEVDTFSRTSPLHHYVAASPVRVDAAQLDSGVGGQSDRGTSARADLGVAQAQRAALNT
jgi:putative transposase